MEGKGGQQYNVDQCPYNKHMSTHIIEMLHSKGTHVKLQGDVVHNKSSKMM
jgi:hypothetical protein